MWSQNGNNFSRYDKAEELAELPPGVYTLRYGMFGSMYLERNKDKYEFPYKLYGQSGFPDRVKKAWKAGTGNLGVLLIGLKGTGKTVEAEQICNIMNLPVILVAQDYDHGKDLVTFLGGVDQDVVVLMDEYEKVFEESDHALLSIMDGAMNAKNRRLWLLTANHQNINDALLDRPSRIYYKKKFGNLHTEVITEVVDDMLKYKKFRQEVVDFLGMLEIITIDIVKTVIREVNIHNESPSEFKDFLNVTISKQERWDLFDSDGAPIMTWARCQHLDPFHKSNSKRVRLSMYEYGEEWKEYGIYQSCDKKTGKIVTDQGTYYLKKAKAFSSKETLAVTV